MGEIIAAVLPSLMVSLFMAYFNRQQALRDKEREKHEVARQKEMDQQEALRQAEAKRQTDIRKKEWKLSMDLQLGTGKLALASAVAIKENKINGEMDDGIKSFKKAKENYLDFVNEQATDHINSK